jgi:eukaryotic-like serine/threonine-protein kinase
MTRAHAFEPDSLELERLVRRFEAAWQHSRPALGDFLPADPAARLPVLLELVLTDLEYRLKAGESARVETYLSSYPELAADAAALRDLASAEYRLRRRRESDLTPAEYAERFPGVNLPAVPESTPEIQAVTPAVLRLACPHCRTPLEAVQGVGRVTCPGCRATVGLVPSPATPGSRLDKYELHEVLGRGGFGVVYKARDTELGRTVAVKVPRPGSFLTAADVDRFLREARSAAQLQHPAIVAVHDAGRLDDSCYIVSEFVEGQTLAGRLAAGRPPAREAADLIARVADALHYAHTHGVVHRDVKPSNILLDVEGRPHLTDFGLAKRDAGEVSLTEDGQVLGTPAYMSPEQARGEARRVDARTDIYGLGAVFYELLTGDPPFRGTARMLLKQVLEDEPRPPRRLNDRVARDLETVCLKCLEKDPAKRYATAGDLADDLRRFLKGEPVRARPVGPVGRAWRWCRRRPAAAALAGVSLAAAVGLLAGWAWFTAALRTERDNARRGWSQAEDNLLGAVGAVDQFYTQVSEGRLLREPGLKPVRHELLRNAAEYYRQFVERNRDNARVRLELARAYRRLGAIAHELGSFKPATEYYGQAERLFAQLAAEGGRDDAFQLAQTYVDRGHLHHVLEDLPRAEADFRRGLALLESGAGASASRRRLLARARNQLGSIHALSGRSGPALESFRGSLDLLERLAAEQPDSPDVRSDLAAGYNHLADFYLQTGRGDEADKLLQRVQTMTEQTARDHPDDLDYQFNAAYGLARLADAHRFAGRFDKALPLYEQALARVDGLLRTHPQVSRWRASLVAFYHNQASAYQQMNRPDEAKAYYAKTLAVLEPLRREHPTFYDYLNMEAAVRVNLGTMARAAGRTADAEADLKKGLALREQIDRDLPDSLHNRRQLAVAWNHLGQLYGRDRSGPAEEAFRRSVDILDPLARDYPDILDLAVTLGGHLCNFGHFLRDGGKPDAALDCFDRAVRTLEGVGSTGRQNASARPFLRNSYAGRALTLVKLRRPAEALPDLDRVVDMSTPAQRRGIELLRAATRARAGDHAGATGEANQILGAGKPSIVTLFDAARVYALSAAAAGRDADLPTPKRQELAEKYAARAVALLAQCHMAGGFRKPAEVKRLREDDLAPLKDRADFRKLLTAVKTKPPAE